MAIERDLAAPLDPRRVQTREGSGGKKLSYLKAHDVKRTANRIFGYDGWSYVVDDLISLGEEPFKNSKGREGIRVGYRATVTVTIGDVRRGDVGYGDAMEYNGSRITPHELAAKEAVSDALKRSLSSWGDQFGLVLYGEDPAPLPEDADDALPAPSPRPRPAAAKTSAKSQQPPVGGSDQPSGDSDLEEHKRAHRAKATSELKLPPGDAREIISDGQVQRLWTIARRELSLDNATVKNVVVAVTNQESTKLIPDYLYDQVIKELRLVAAEAAT